MIRSRWKNWGPGQKVRGPRPPGPGLEPPLAPFERLVEVGRTGSVVPDYIDT